MKNNPYKWALILGVLLLLCSIWMMIIGPVALDNLPDGWKSPVLFFEFLQSKAEVAQLFSVPEPELYRAKMDLLNEWDYLFMAIYGLFLATFSFAAYKVTQQKVLLLGVFLALVAWAADAVENIQLLFISQNFVLGDISQSLLLLNMFTWLKWGAITSSFLLLSGYFFPGKWFEKLCGVVLMFTFCLSVAVFFYHSLLNEVMALGVSICFLLLFIHTIRFRWLQK